MIKDEPQMANDRIQMNTRGLEFRHLDFGFSLEGPCND